METDLKYGTSTLKLRLDTATSNVIVIASTQQPPVGPEAELVAAALEAPIGSPVLSAMLSRGQRVVVITSDITRPCPSDCLLPPVLNQLRQSGIRDQDITVVFGLGSHRGHTADERARLAGQDVYRRVRCIDSNPDDVQLIGHTKRGTPVTIFRPVLEADARVCLGAIDYHWFVGYGAGYKGIVPAVSGIETIRANHRWMTAPGAVPGKRIDNPVREDIDEAGAMAGVDFILNVILDESKRIVTAVAGHPVAAHQEGCRRLDALRRVTIAEPVDVVVVSAGGYPKDINLYQAQKALDNARHIVRQGGIILLVAACREGMGHPVFERWMTEGPNPDAILTRIEQDFVLGGHKAAGVARAMKHARVFLVSALPRDLAHSIGFHPFDSLESAVRAALSQVGARPRLAVMPQGGSVLASVA
jgi:nickel-dependent lactate racemase